ncbi:hypothetical protein ANANG_G00175970 [Anguilla anguilla]|uniref:CARD domain-containing protein n=1 Tax=Anguilla anguilla TaxID=7936 RepID=A0A9D3M4C0_ANGAN|nr:hypothetical protein ANANG_G00175970 [Anguilla anguilla]
MAESRDHGMRFLEGHKEQIIERVRRAEPIVDAAVSQHLVREELAQGARAAVSPQDVMRELFEALEAEILQRRDTFYQILKQVEPDLIQELEQREAEHKEEEVQIQMEYKYEETKEVEKMKAEEAQMKKDSLKRRREGTLRAIEEIERLWEATKKEGQGRVGKKME